MISHRPNDELLEQFAAGVLPASMSLAIATHCEFCTESNDKVQMYTEQLADSTIGQTEQTMPDVESMFDFEAMIDEITCSEQIDDWQPSAPLEVEVNGNRYPLPRSLSTVAMRGWQKLGKLSRARIDLGEGKVHTSLLHIEEGGVIPDHSHKGQELTLLLAGSFEDEMGQYQAGDFILLDGEHSHSPMATSDCLCLTVVDDALSFNQGISKLLNPIGRFIY